jgi:hypothetical protein
LIALLTRCGTAKEKNVQGGVQPFAIEQDEGLASRRRKDWRRRSEIRCALTESSKS